MLLTVRLNKRKATRYLHKHKKGFYAYALVPKCHELASVFK